MVTEAEPRSLLHNSHPDREGFKLRRDEVEASNGLRKGSPFIDQLDKAAWTMLKKGNYRLHRLFAKSAGELETASY